MKKPTEQTQDVYNLRNGRLLVKNKVPETKHETLTFKYFFPKLLKALRHFDFSLRKESFKLQVNLKLNEDIEKILNHVF